MNWTWPITQKGLLGAYGNSKIMSALGLPVPAVEGGRAMSQCEGAAAVCVYSVSQQGHDITKGLPESWRDAQSSIQGPEELCVM